jgi:fumarate reductase subunit D
MARVLKPSWQPPFWLLFGAGGMLAALIGPALVFVTGLAGPTGHGVPAATLDYDRAVAFARHPLGKAFLWVVVSLLLWHAAHRLYHTLHDVGLPTGTPTWIACYGTAAAGTVVAAMCLLLLGW